MKKLSNIFKVIVCLGIMMATLSISSNVMASNGIDASNYSEKREELEETANGSNVRKTSSMMDYTFGTYGRVHIDGWNVGEITTSVGNDGYHTITFQTLNGYNLPSENHSASDLRFVHVQDYTTQGTKSYTVNEDKTVGTLRFKPKAAQDKYDATPILVRLVGVDQQTPEDNYLSSRVFIEVSHKAISFTNEETTANVPVSFQLDGSRTYLVKKDVDLKVYPTDNAWFKPIENSNHKTGIASSSDFSNRYFILEGSTTDRMGDRITYDGTMFSVSVKDEATSNWVKKSYHDFYHENQSIAMPNVEDSNLQKAGYRLIGFKIEQLVYEPTIANSYTWDVKEVGFDYVINTNSVDYNVQWTSTGVDPTYDQTRESSLRQRVGNIFISGRYIKQYTVKFVDYDGSPINVQTIDQGSNANAPMDPVREGFTFTGWDKGYTNVQGDLVVAAMYSENPKADTVSVTFVDYNGKILSHQEITKGSEAIAPVDPIREGYTFTGWDKGYTNVQSDIVISATYSENTVAETVKVTFVDYNGTIISNQEIIKGSDASAPANPTRDGFTFIGWDKAYTNVQNDIVVSAMYSENPKADTVNVTFVDYDGTLLSSQVILRGSDASAPANPTRDGFTFTGWDKAYTNVQSDIVVVANYTENITAVPPVDTTPPAPTAPQQPTPVVQEVNQPVVETTPDNTQNNVENNTVEKQDNTETEVVKDKVTPKAKGVTGSWALFNLIATIVTILIAILLVFAKHHKEENEKGNKNYEEEPITAQYVRRRWTKVVAIAIAIISIVAFVLTENMTLPMILVDKWTVAMLVILLVQTIILVIGRRWKDDNKDQNEPQKQTKFVNQSTL